MKIAYFWTWDFSKNILKDIINDKDFDVLLWVSQIDKPVWRKRELVPTQVKQVCLENNIEILQPTKLKNPEFVEKLKSLELDFIVVVAYWKIIPIDILNIPKYGCINIHWSILPKYRWASPIQESIKNWDTETWLTIMYMSEWMDEWDIVKIKKTPIDILDTTPDIFKKFEDFWAELLKESLEWIIKWELISQSQNDSEATYCKKINKSDGEVNFENETAFEIYNKYRSYYPWPWIFTFYKWKKISITNCFFQEDLSQENNEIWNVIKFEKNIWIICKKWVLILNKVKLEWKKEVWINDFINGNKDFLDYNFINN